MSEWVTWRVAMERALYGDGGFYRRGEPARAHFRTSVHASRRFAAALARLLSEVDEALGRPERFDLIDIGAGRGELLTAIAAEAAPDVKERLALVAVEVAPRPPGLPAAIHWQQEPPAEIIGMVVANEWLDNVALDVVELTLDGPRLVLVDPATGAERPGPTPGPADLAWLERWWPLWETGERAEVGLTRCGSWEAVTGRVRHGVALAVDYSHKRSSRPRCGTLTGYRNGRAVPPVPDGSCDITAHVALDACAEAAGERGSTVHASQRSALRALGLTGARPPLDLARSSPRAYVSALSRASEEAELIDPSGLGGFGWLAQAIGVPMPPSLVSTQRATR